MLKGKPIGACVEANIRPNHINVPMRKIDKAEDAIDHGVAQSNQGIQATELNPENQLLDENPHALLSDLLGSVYFIQDFLFAHDFHNDRGFASISVCIYSDLTGYAGEILSGGYCVAKIGRG